MGNRLLLPACRQAGIQLSYRTKKDGPQDKLKFKARQKAVQLISPKVNALCLNQDS
jgi:hypothetical protein